MKKIINFFGSITLIVTSATSLVVCNKPIHKDKNNNKSKLKSKSIIISYWSLIDNSLNNIKKEFKFYNNKWYFIIWKRGNIEGFVWETMFFKYNESAPRITGGWLSYIKSIYRWDGINEPKTLKINDSGIVVDLSEKIN